MSLLAIRPGERRDAWAAFLTLFGLIGSHAILETARDALFLAKVPAAHLPWVFLSVAGLSFVVVRLQALLGGKLAARPALAVWTVTASTVTFGFFALLDRLGHAGLYALYIWSGLLTTLLLVHFWTLVGNLFSVTQAKRLYGFIGAGSVLGAIAGSGAASALARMLPPQQLLLVSAIGFVSTAGVPFLFHDAARAPGERAEARSSLAENLRYVRESVYAQRVVALLFVSTICLTLADFLFKSMVAQLVPAAQLGAFLGTVYFALNIASLVCQLLLVSRLLKHASLGAALALLPALLTLGGLGIAVGGGLAAVLALKGADGSLRYSLHRTASELLFLPFGEEARQRVKGFMDVVGQRGGQVVASLALLGLAALGAPPRVLAIILVVAAATWVTAALALREPYLEVFRARLRTGKLSHIADFPELDVGSLESLVAALDSANDKEVLAALNVLERENKAHLVPALILYHPVDAVVECALGIFTRAQRTNVVHVIDRVLEHPSPRVRAATIAARSVLAPDAQTLLMRMSLEESSEVRATITVNLIASGDIYGADAKERLDALLLRGTAQTKVALANAIAVRGASGFDDVLIALTKAPEREVRLAAVRAMAKVTRPSFIPALIERLGEEATRTEAASALAGYGDDALRGLRSALETKEKTTALRWRIPHAMTLLDPQAAASALVAWLPHEPDGSVRFQIIRALERLVRRTPDLVLDDAILSPFIEHTVGRAFRTLEARMVLVRGAAARDARLTTGHELLALTLQDKENNAIERIFRLLGLLHPTEDFAQIHRGLREGREARATSSELIDNILVDPLRAAVRGLVDDLPDEERLRHSGKYHAPLGLEYEALLTHMLGNDSEAIREIVGFHCGELGLPAPPAPPAEQRQSA